MPAIDFLLPGKLLRGSELGGTGKAVPKSIITKEDGFLSPEGPGLRFPQAQENDAF